MSPDPVYGDVIDDRTVEVALVDTIKLWIDEHLAIQEDRYGQTKGAIERPNSWPTISQFDLKLHDMLPAIIVVYNGTVASETKRTSQGFYRQTFSYDVTIALSGADENDSRTLASKYLAAIKSSVLQNRTLGGIAEATILVGPDRPNVGRAIGVTTGAERAIYGTTFHVQVKDTVCDRLGPTAVPTTPYEPPGLPPAPEAAEFTVEVGETS